MTKVITDEKMIDEVLERGVEQIFPDKKTLKEKLMSGERIRLYCGYDPTAPSLHIGNAVTINKLSQFQKLGHEIIFLIGDFTCMIGDPTDKLATRKKMTREEILENAKGYQKQASGYLKFDGENPAQIMYNSEWNDKLTFKELIELSSNFTVQQMIQRDMFQKRMAEEKPIYLHEFLYPLTQGYDSVVMNVDLEIGGNDQMFNMLAGRTLQKNINNKEKFVVTLKLLADETGKKMGKSEGNAVFLDQAPQDMYGAVMSWTDGTIAVGFEMATNVSMQEVKEVEEALKDEKNNPRDYKMKLAYEMVKINYGEEAADKAQENFVRTVQKKEVPDVVVEENGNNGEKLIDFIVRAKLASSNGDAKRKIEQGGVSIDGEIVKDIQIKISKDMNGKILKVGKREFRKIIVK
ncbi:MAG: tyrosine--tRNA ligase [bacterium]|nr:tyrosine--tRNA ligase [bacterium]